MERIAIIGCGGSGKTTIARQLGRLLDLPVTHLDAIYYDQHWRPLARDDFAAEQDRLVASKRWLIEGNYASTLPIRLAAADTVIFLDLPAATCLWGIVQRRWSYRGGQHHHDGVFDRITWSFITYIWGYRKSMRPRVTALAAQHAPHASLITLSSRRAANAFIAQLCADGQPRRARRCVLRGCPLSVPSHLIFRAAGYAGCCRAVSRRP
jgi:adenylate kinase family enzyme